MKAVPFTTTLKLHYVLMYNAVYAPCVYVYSEVYFNPIAFSVRQIQMFDQERETQRKWISSIGQMVILIHKTHSYTYKVANKIYIEKKFNKTEIPSALATFNAVY